MSEECCLTERVLAGADGLVSDTISWMASRSLRRCSGLLIPISLWISVSERLAMMAPLFTLARHAATYQAGMPTHSCRRQNQHAQQLTSKPGNVRMHEGATPPARRPPWGRPRRRRGVLGDRLLPVARAW